ncbi:MAG TPA: response regulator [Thermoflexales bacterium]|nr:response regulator [Thermoflexales bacterium]HQY26778.1 response regulator [Thermoflexales bacterium]HQZ54389.1 response regulator [Thermoflexales bacterium]HRA55282.1 response regulator [Thermoflexales bacterium]
MVRIYIADGLAEERSALRLVLRSLDMVVVGEAADWETTLAKAPATRLDILMVDWGLLPDESGTALDLLRAACPGAVIVILISHMDARQQAALSAGADVFISKGELPERVAERLRGIAASVPLK